jgi:hypothetical protein
MALLHRHFPFLAMTTGWNTPWTISLTRKKYIPTEVQPKTTKNVLKSAALNAMRFASSNLEELKNNIGDLEQEIKSKLDELAGFDSGALRGSSMGGYSRDNPGHTQLSPESSWGSTQKKHNIGGMKMISDTPGSSDSLLSQVEKILSEAGNGEEEAIQALALRFKDIADNIRTLSAADLFQQILVIVAESAIDTFVSVANASIKVGELLFETAIAVIDTVW